MAFYTDRTAWEAAVGSPTVTIDFEDYFPDTQLFWASPPGTPVSFVRDGVTFSDPFLIAFSRLTWGPGPIDEGVLRFTIPYDDPQNVPAGWPPAKMVFPSGICGAGLKLFSSGGSGNSYLLIAAADASTTIGPVRHLAPDLAVSFFGVASQAELRELSFPPAGGIPEILAVELSLCSASPADANGDGIVDSLQPAGTPDGSFVDEGAAPATTGSVVSGSVSVVDAVDVAKGVTITAVGGPAEVAACGLPMTIALEAGGTVTITCGSVTILSEQGDVTVVSAGATIGIPDGATATLDVNPQGATVVSGVSGGQVTVEVNGVAAVVPPGATLTVAAQYSFVGFEQPVDMDGFNVAKAGSAIPLKWRVLDAEGVPVTSIGAASVSVRSSDRCGNGAVGDVIETYVSGQQSALQNLGGGFYQLDWKTNKGWKNTCKELVFSVDGAIVLDANPALQFT